MEEASLSRLTALGHPQRMQVFRLLMRRHPDAVPAGEIADALSLKANTLSVYLSTLMAAGLICQERRGTSLRYRSDMSGARELVCYLFEDCCRGRPDLCPPLAQQGAPDIAEPRGKKLKALFVCTGNSARSIFAESILRDTAGDRFDVHSAGTHPASRLNPFAVRMLKDRGTDVSLLRAKHISEFLGPDAPAMDFVFTVCDKAANEDCPVWQGQPITAHWGVPDPVRVQGSDAEKGLAFQRAYGLLRNRIAAFAALPTDVLDRASLQGQVDEISRRKEKI
jgi:arsenate reductase